MKLSQIAKNEKTDSREYIGDIHSAAKDETASGGEIARLVLNISLADLDVASEKLTSEQKSVVSLVFKLINSKTDFDIDNLVYLVIRKINGILEDMR